MAEIRPILIVSIALLVTLAGIGAFLIPRSDATVTPEQLSYWTHTDPNRTVLEEDLITAFEVATGADAGGMRIDRTTYGSQEISELVLTAFAAGRGPDIFNLQIENAYSYIVNGQVIPVDPKALGFEGVEELVDLYLPGVLEPVTWEGKIYGLPLELTNWAIYLNRSMFRDAGLDPDTDYPRTWEEMVAVSERIAFREEERLVRRGFDFRYSDYLIGIVPMVHQLGGQLVSDDGSTAIVGEEAWIDFLRFFAEWGPHGRNLGSPGYENARVLFNTNDDRVAMAHTGLYQQGRIKAQNPEFYDSDEWMVIPYPTFAEAVEDVGSRYYGHYMMVSADTPPHLQAKAWQFIWFLLDHAEEYLEQVNIVQPRQALVESALYRSIPYSDVFAHEMARSEVVYYGEHSAELQELVEEAVESVLFGTATPEKAYVRLRAHGQELFDR